MLGVSLHQIEGRAMLLVLKSVAGGGVVLLLRVCCMSVMCESTSTFDLSGLLAACA